MRAREAEQKASRRKSQLASTIALDVQMKAEANPAFWRTRNLELEISVLTDAAASKDPSWKSHVAMNQWHTQYAIMYGNAATSDKLDELIKAMKGE